MEKWGGQSSGQETFRSSTNSSTESTHSKSRFAYLGNGEPIDPIQPSLGERLWGLYGSEDLEGVSDGTLQHEIGNIIRQVKQE
jgi:hypothetical protein